MTRTTERRIATTLVLVGVWAALSALALIGFLA
jgi:hypothetical protein